MKLFHNPLFHFNIVFLFIVFFQCNLFASWSFYDKFHIKCNGEVTEQLFCSENIDLLNSAIADDSISYVLSTLDYFISADYGDKKDPRLSFYADMRFRYAWGSDPEMQLIDSSVKIVDTVFNVPGKRANKHLVWMRTGWFKLIFGADPERQKHFIQAGLISFEIGRGISLGAAYETAGFLGFTPTYSIDEYAPAILLSINPSGKNIINFYIALIDSEQTSLSHNLAPAHLQEIGSFHTHGAAENSYIVALQNKTYFQTIDKDHNIVLEPYLIYLYAPNKNLEFKQDVDAMLSTAGVCVEAEYKKMNWGFECAYNFGDVYLKPLDRNQITTVNSGDGLLVEQYTKIYNEDQKTAGAMLVDATTANAVYVDASPQDPDANGQQIGPALFNAYDRFRPAQYISLNGYYFIADIAYDYIPKVLQGGIGVAYFSGDARRAFDLNELTHESHLNQNFSAFIPIQSIYSGKRIRHFVMLNQGIPRYTIQSTQANFATNVSSPLTIDTLNSTTNLAFIGTRLAYSPESFSHKKMLIAPNIIAYWAPETGFVSNKQVDPHASLLGSVDNYLGTEFNIEFSFEFVPNLKFAGYAGMLVPGAYYKDICGTIVKDFNLPISNSIAFICDMAISYSF